MTWYRPFSVGDGQHHAETRRTGGVASASAGPCRCGGDPMTVNNLMQAALYALAPVVSVAAFAVALLSSTSAIERWLDADRSTEVRVRRRDRGE